MIISYNTAYSNFSLNNGFGRAGYNIVTSLNKLGHQVYVKTPVAPVEFTFAQPDYFEPNNDQYQIIMTPWESTELHEGWVDKFNSADETWATSDWVAEVYKKAGVKNLITVFPHGIEKTYTPKLRKKRGPLKYLHLGGPANRKGAQEAFDAFREVFKDDPNKATLTIKAYQRNLVRWYDSSGRVRNPAELPNVNVVTTEMEADELVKFQSKFDVNIYPSYGEGWGFIPMESLALGQPTICPSSWCHYREFLGELAVDSVQINSPWPQEHPGMVYKPVQEDLTDKIKLSYEDYDRLALNAFRNSFELHDKYDWVKLTEQAFEPVVERFS